MGGRAREPVFPPFPILQLEGETTASRYLNWGGERAREPVFPPCDNAVGSRTFAYNDKSQLISETISGIYSKTITRNYATTGTVMGRYTGLQVATGGSPEYGVGYGYDTYGRLNQVVNGSDTFTYGYLANSNLVNTITRPNNLSTTFGFENNRDLITGVENKYDATTVSNYGYVNDAIGRRTSMARTGTAFASADALAYTYNDRSEVTGATSNVLPGYDYSYSFDNLGNRSVARTGTIETTYAANNLNQYTNIATGTDTFTPGYDDDGNMLNYPGWTFTWNGENRLISAVNAAGTQKLEFVYDYIGRRVEKKVFDITTTPEGATLQLVKHERFVYDGFKQIEKLNALADNAIINKFVWQPGGAAPLRNSASNSADATEAMGMDVPLSVSAVNSELATVNYYYFTDANKNIGQLMDASGNIVAKYEYSPFGKVISSSGNYADANPFQFSSEYADDETGLVYYNFRYYSPELGRWLCKDPIEEQGGINTYAFIDNNGVDYRDRFGLIIETPLDIAFVAWDISSLIENIWNGNWQDAGLDILSIVPDAFLAATPGLPAVVGASQRTARNVAKELAEQICKKKKAINSTVGDLIRTPTTFPDDFIKKGPNYVNKNTGEIWQKSHTKHSGGDEWKVGPKPGEPPTPTRKTTVTPGGEILKHDK